MKKILLIHGPNLNFLGKRDPAHYGQITLPELVKKVVEYAAKLDLDVMDFQSNHEGDLIDFIQENASDSVGIIINPGALTHYSYALHDALVDGGVSCVEVHLSDIQHREEWRRKSVIAPACVQSISGKKEVGYFEAVDLLISN